MSIVDPCTYWVAIYCYLLLRSGAGSIKTAMPNGQIWQPGQGLIIFKINAVTEMEFIELASVLPCRDGAKLR